ncbi:MAG: M1 family metallopeptidase, partial [Anaerolineae bacterium]|nr:M1 family metallopeptidase [Anaerolineae bacterium]
MPHLKPFIFLALMFSLLLVACQQPSREIEPTQIPTETEAAISKMVTAVPPPSPTSPTTPTHSNNLDIYRAGLTTAAQDSLDDLSNASIYDIEVDINFDEALVTGNQSVVYTNNHATELAEVYFHLLPNLLSGTIDLSNVTVDGEPVEPVLEEAFDSVMRVPLETPLAPGESVTFEMDFVTAVPNQLERNYGVFAQVDDIMALSHFYPMVAVYDDEGWNIAPASEQGDATYSDAAFYHVTVTADEEQVVAGSGVALRETNADGKQTIELAIGPARDFYLAISPRYEKVSRTVGETTINSYAPAEFMHGAEDAAAFAADALRIFNERFEPYPYTELDIVATSTLALGIEYPGIIALTSREYDPDNPVNPNVPNEIYMETTTAHEVAHQWFYNLVGNDQLDEPWLDEAVTQYVTYLYYLDMYGEAAANEYKESWNGRFDRVDN